LASALIPEAIHYVVSAFLILAVIFTTIRFIRGPTVADRIVALDNITTIIIALLVYLALFYGRYIYLDVALVSVILGFIGTIVLARYLEAKHK